MSGQWKPEAGKMAGVQVAQAGAHGGFAVECPGQSVTWLPRSALHPIPPGLSPEAQAVLDAAAEELKWEDEAEAEPIEAGRIRYGHLRAKTARADAVRAYRATLPPPKPPDPIEELIAAGEGLAAIENEFARAQSDGTMKGPERRTYTHSGLRDARARWNAAITAVRAGKSS